MRRRITLGGIRPYDAEVTYIENTGLQYIDTGYKPNQNTRIVCSMRHTANTSYGRLFGCVGGTSYNSTPNYVLNYETNVTGHLQVLMNDSSWKVISSISGDYNTHTYDLNKTQLYRDGTLVYTHSAVTFQCTTNLAIFAYMKSSGITDASTEYMIGRCYSFQIYENDVLIRDFIPVRVGQEGFLYDEVSGQLFGNMGSGSFAIGSDVGETLIDFGLPSGKRWATCNLGANSPEEYGLFFSWGNIVGHVPGDGYSFDQASYSTTPAYSLPQNTDLPKSPTYDAAMYMLGEPYSIPTKADFEELKNNTTITMNATVNGVLGLKAASNSDPDKYIFFPYYTMTGTTLFDTSFDVWTRTAAGYSNRVYAFSCDKTTNANVARYKYEVGAYIRAIAPPSEMYVDLGLPSGTLWARGNICKDSNGNYYIGDETDYGCYFTFGDTVGQNEGEGHFSQQIYESSPAVAAINIRNIKGTDYDTAHILLRSNWYMPNTSDLDELNDNTNRTFVSNYNGTGINGLKFTNKSDSSKFIFMPASGAYGWYGETNLDKKNVSGIYRSSTMRTLGAQDCYVMSFSSSSFYVHNGSDTWAGFPVRPIYVGN